MSLAVAVMILLIVLIIAALALFLIATIVQLVKINRGLAVVIGAVGEIVAKTAPINGVLDAINSTLGLGSNLLEGLFVKKAGDDAGGLVESLFPGEGAKFLQRVGRRGPVVNTGEVYTRGVGILVAIGRTAPIGAAHVRAPQPATTVAPEPEPAPAEPPEPEPEPAPSGRISLRRRPDFPGTAAPEPAPAPPEPPPAPTGRISIRRPDFPGTAAPVQRPAPAPAASAGGGGAEAEEPPASPEGRLSARAKRPWER